MSSYVIPERVLVQRVVSDTVLLDTSLGAYFELNAMGSEMLRRLQETGDPESVIASLEREYDVTEGTLRNDLSTLIDQLMEHGLVERREPA